MMPHQYFILSPLILDAKDYLALKNGEDALWLIIAYSNKYTNAEHFVAI